MKVSALTTLSLLSIMPALSADVSMPNLFSDHMVLQRELADPVWGKADPGETVTVSFNGQTLKTVADGDGKWRVELAPMEAGGPFDMTIKGNNEVVIKDILIGEVWVCSGQSNMQWSVNKSNDAELEKASANFPNIRLLNMPRKGTQEPQEDQEGTWVVCSPETVGGFSAVGYFFGRRLNQTLDVPVGLIHNAWGGSAAEAWVPREMLLEHEQFEKFVTDSDKRVEEHTDEVQAAHVEKYHAERAEWEANGKKGRSPRWPSDPRYNQHRPGNIYNGGVFPILGYGIRGMIWYQGETNAGRHSTYEQLINIMVTNFREQWGQGDFPFYFVQLADYRAEQGEPGDSNWPRLREAQTKTVESLANSGQAVIIDVGEGRDIHPRNKQTVANRLVLWALANDYGYDIHYRSPEFAEMEVIEVDGAESTDTPPKAALLTFDYVSDAGLYSFDKKEIDGFAIAGEDQQWVWADAEIIGKNQVRVWSDEVAEPVAVRYGWAMNPVVNLQDRNGLPVTPFRTDDWPMPAN